MPTDPPPGALSGKPASFSLELRNDFADLSRAVREANRFLESASLAPDVVYRANLGIEEMLTNIIKYGYDDEAEHRIALSFLVEDAGLRLVIEDNGHRFDPREATAPRLDRPLCERRAGGLGIHLVLSMMDRVDYRRIAGRNILELSLRSRPDPEPR